MAEPFWVGARVLQRVQILHTPPAEHRGTVPHVAGHDGCLPQQQPSCNRLGCGGGCAAQGVGKKGVGSDSSMEVRYGVDLRVEIVPSGGQRGNKENKYRDINFKVLPKGKANVPGGLIEFPVLDVGRG